MAAPEGMLSAYFVIQMFHLLWEPSKLFDTTGSWKPLLERGQHLVEIFDVPFSSRESTRIIVQATDIDKQHGLKQFPTQEMHTIRVYFGENMYHGGEHIDENGKTIRSGDDWERSIIDRTSFAGSPAMISQWGLSSKQIQWETHSYKLPLRWALKGGDVLLERATREIFVEPSYIDSTLVVVGIIRRRLRCMIVSTEDGRIICEYIPPI